MGVQTDSDGSQLPAITMEQLEEVPRIDGYPIKIDEYTYERK